MICVPAGAIPKFSKPNRTLIFPEIDSPSFGEIKYTDALLLLGDNSIACNEHESKKINKYLI